MAPEFAVTPRRGWWSVNEYLMDNGTTPDACNSTENTAATSMWLPVEAQSPRKAAHDPTTPEHVWLGQWLRLFGNNPERVDP